VEVSCDRARATVGDRILEKVAVTHPREVTVLPPSPVSGDGLAVHLEPVPPPAPAGPRGRETEPPRSPVQDLFFFHAQAFETGKTSLPAFQVDWTGPGGKSGSVSSERVPLEIASVLKGPQDQPADLKPPARLPPPPFPWKKAGLAALALALLAAAVFFYVRRKRPAPVTVAAPALPGIPPHELAYQELERLLASSLLQEGRLKEFHVELSEIIKRYLAGRFGIETLEKTSEEVLLEMKRARVGSESMGLVREFFSTTDLVKFAKHHPPEEEVRGTVDGAYRLVDRTKLVVSPAPPVAGETPPAFSAQAAP